METSFTVRSSGKGRKKIGPDLKRDGHRPGNVARRKNDASPSPRVLRPIWMWWGQNTLSSSGLVAVNNVLT